MGLLVAVRVFFHGLLAARAARAAGLSTSPSRAPQRLGGRVATGTGYPRNRSRTATQVHGWRSRNAAGASDGRSSLRPRKHGPRTHSVRKDMPMSALCADGKWRDRCGSSLLLLAAVVAGVVARAPAAPPAASEYIRMGDGGRRRAIAFCRRGRSRRRVLVQREQENSLPLISNSGAGCVGLVAPWALRSAGNGALRHMAHRVQS